jgi:hypothetical protein
MDLLCSANTTHPPHNQRKGIYKFTCPIHKMNYIGQTARRIETKAAEHKKAIEKSDWHHSGLTQHLENCSHQIDWQIEPTIITTLANKNKKKLDYDLKIREALEIRCHNSGPGRGMNEDWGGHVESCL